jgi:hypothetical protein
MEKKAVKKYRQMTMGEMGWTCRPNVDIGDACTI